jgi:hypothetical protein
MLQKSHFFLEFLGVLSEIILFPNVFSVGATSFKIIKMAAIRIKDDFSGIVEIDAGGLV